MKSDIERKAGAASRCSALLAESPTFEHVLEFAFRMEAKLAKNRHKGDRAGWIADHPWNLVERVLDETVELQRCFSDEGMVYDGEDVADECADTANFCMMVADVVTTDEKERIAIAKSANGRDERQPPGE